MRYGRRHWCLAACLAALAGYVDAIGFIKLGGLFVSFMSGNSTRLAVGVASRSEIAGTAASLIGLFVAGVVVGHLIAARVGRWRKVAVLISVCLLLCGSAVAASSGADRWAVGLMTIAMGAANAVFQRDGEVSIGVTYMTGTLVKMGQRAAMTLQGGPLFGWLPYLILWSSLVAGAILGASLYPRIGSATLWAAAAFAGVLSAFARTLGPVRR